MPLADLGLPRVSSVAVASVSDERATASAGTRRNGHTELSCVIKQIFTLSTIQQFI